MSKVRYKIALLTGGAVLLTMMIILILFNVLMRRSIEQNARESIESVLSTGKSDSQSLYTPSVIEFLGESLGIEYEHTRAEKKIIAYCDAEKPEGIVKAEINKNIYYLQDKTLSVTELAESSSEDDEFSLEILKEGIIGAFLPLLEGQRFIAYIDVTAETELIGSMTVFFLINAVVIAIAAGICGYLIGRNMERSQQVQKQFFENTSHELKTPLTSIRGYAEGISTGVITDYARTGRIITEQTEKMSRLVEEILLVSKLESGAMALKREELELGEFIENCLMPLEGAVMSRGLSVSLELGKRTVLADPDRLDQAVSNILTNAIKYAKSSLRISLDERHLLIGNDCDGLTDDELRHIFERFYTGRNGNTGIGLALAKEIIELHGWSITACRSADGIVFDVAFK